MLIFLNIKVYQSQCSSVYRPNGCEYDGISFCFFLFVDFLSNVWPVFEEASRPIRIKTAKWLTSAYCTPSHRCTHFTENDRATQKAISSLRTFPKKEKRDGAAMFFASMRQSEFRSSDGSGSIVLVDTEHALSHLTIALLNFWKPTTPNKLSLFTKKQWIIVWFSCCLRWKGEREQVLYMVKGSFVCMSTRVGILLLTIKLYPKLAGERCS